MEVAPLTDDTAEESATAATSGNRNSSLTFTTRQRNRLAVGKVDEDVVALVASPAGTTIAGVHALEQGGLRAALMDAVEAATLRAIELGK